MFYSHLQTAMGRLPNVPVLPIVFSLALAACGGSIDRSATLDDANDPFEGFNRSMFSVNLTLDHYVLEPAAKGYLFVPEPVRMSLRRFLDNLSSPVILANDGLQGQWARAGTTASRLGINTTIGLLGFFDPASGLGFERHTEDFGQTLGAYGAGEGPYVYLPVLGPSPPRDLLGVGVDTMLDPVTHILDDGSTGPILVFALKGIDSRATNMGLIDEIERSSVDYYASVRSLYRQNRNSEIANGKTNMDDLPDIDDLDDF